MFLNQHVAFVEPYPGWLQTIDVSELPVEFVVQLKQAFQLELRLADNFPENVKNVEEQLLVRKSANETPVGDSRTLTPSEALIYYNSHQH